MQLILSSSSPWNTTYCNEAGQVLFKTETFGPDIVRISRLRMTDQKFEVVGEVEFHVFENSKITYRGEVHDVDHFFTKSGLGLFGQ
jgi:hypothetical protein